MTSPDPISPIRSFRLDVPESELEHLRDRLRRTRWPEPETTTGKDIWDQGPPLETVRELVEYWATGYDWRRLESELNSHGQAMTEIDGLDIHLLHVRSPRPDARPLVITHGWPSSVVEPLEIIDALVDPADPDAPAFHVVAPSLPGFGFGARPSGTGWTVERTADAWVELMRRLGYDRFLAAGGDWGGRVTARLAHAHPDHVIGMHTFTPYVSEPAGGPGPLTELESQWVADTRWFHTYGGGYSLQQSTRPQTLAYALVDSPLALLTWILDKFHLWTDRRSPVSRDRILDTVMLYWLSGTGGSAVRFYWENFPPRGNDERVGVPASVTVFPADIEKFPRFWVEQRFRDLRSFSVAERGGHFPMLEVPAGYAGALRRSLGSMT
ncbi:alpha/beta fold hydrolase [Nakamurella sp. YIM 132087]|uniref:Alpha/beta fold hydrolase n=1 Tax=Nakamurella alba TaxID=2665158 RepID=A0A7K1FET0_9ACTN|nr:epoxide hydrolase family protein [Nakamurella alba]MTD12611.1 alpha/beta fold hydrolase [Nakamurella alba]